MILTMSLKTQTNLGIYLQHEIMRQHETAALCGKSMAAPAEGQTDIHCETQT